MRVICIDASRKGWSSFEDSLCKLTEGSTYTVLKEMFDMKGNLGYLLDEVKSSYPTGEYRASRFIPLSEIDELELTTVNETTLTHQ